MKKKSLFLFLLLVVLTIVGLVLFYRFAQWYDQAMGEIFSYIVIISFILFIFAPFKFIKDKKANISFFSYIKYMSVTVFALTKIVANICKEIAITVSYVVSRFFKKVSDKQQATTQVERQESSSANQDT